MRLFRRMDRYVAGYFMSSYAVCFMFFLGLFIVLDLVPRLDDILESAPLVQERGQSLFLLTVRFYLYKVPEIFLQVAPYLTLMAAMFTVTRLRKANELVPMVMAGVSVFRVLLPLFLLAALLTAAMIAVQEYAASYCATQRLLMESFLIDQDERLVIPQQVMSCADGKNIVVNEFDVNAGVIGSIDISYVEEKNDRQVMCVVTGKNLRWLGPGKGWSVEEGFRREEDLEGAGAGLGGENVPIKTVDVDLTPGDILLFLKSPYDMSLRQIERLYTMNPSDLRYEILLHHHITFPLTNIILLLLGLPFVLRQERHSGFLGIAIALAICLGYFALDVIMRDLGTQNYIPPVLAAWFAVVFCGSLGICIFDSIRT